MDIMSVHTSFGALYNLSIATSEPDISTTSYNSPAIDMIPRNLAPTFTMSGPDPLPRFIFPAKTSHVISSAPLNIPRGSSRRSHSLLALRSDDTVNSKEVLYDNSFRFPSSGSCESPPVSPQTTLPRSGFHKRGTTEFIGDQSIGATPWTYKSTLGVDALVSPPLVESIAKRRGHAHRRSAAISSGDLTIILKPKIGEQTGGSLPNSPNLKSDKFSLLESLPDISKLGDTQIIQPKIEPPLKSPKNFRVGFSDNVQIIPRSLSMASCDSTSYLRHDYSRSNSISSDIPSRANNLILKDVLSANSVVDGRPRTAEPTFDNQPPKSKSHGPKRSGSLPLLVGSTNRPSIEISTPRSLKRWTFFGSECGNGGPSVKSRPSSDSSSYHDHQEVGNSHSKTDDLNETDFAQPRETVITRRSSACDKSTKKKKRVKSWAGSILSNKNKQRNQKTKPKRSSPSPPKFITVSSNGKIKENSTPKPSISKVETERHYTNWKIKNFQQQNEPISPVIDLDAALGPFNTPTSSSGDLWDNSQRSATRKRAMHSAVGLGGFSGLGMHYHRRTESAPEFENPRFGCHRLGSSSKMAMEDVFEEDEDGEWEDTKNVEKDSKPASMNDESDSETRTSTRTDDFVGCIENYSTKLGASTVSQKTSLKWNDQVPKNSVQTLQQNLTDNTASFNCTPPENKYLGSADTYDDSISPKISETQPSASTETEKLEIDEMYNTKTSSVFLTLPLSMFQNSPSTRKSLPSLIHPTSYDAQFISTAPTSVTNEHEFESLFLGEPGPELRISVDDVPSLTSSDSTSNDSVITSEHTIQNSNSEARFRDGQRSASFSATIAKRKRSSVVSLSRLIYSSHGERSKLAIESHSPSYVESENQQKSGNLGRRISRLMKFWKK